MAGLFKGHLLGQWAWLSWGLTMTAFHHSGYLVPWYPLMECILMHDYHHKTFYSQLGTFGVMYRIFGTDGGSDYREWRAEVIKRVAGSALAKS